jgi:hypothetical protein
MIIYVEVFSAGHLCVTKGKQGHEENLGGYFQYERRSARSTSENMSLC